MKTKKQFTKRILSLVLALVMVVSLLPTISFTASAADSEYDGVIGELYYKVDEENGVTTIFGNGALSSTTALVNVMTSIVVIEEGVTSIGNNAFRGFSSLEKLTVKGDVTIGNYAFQGCASLEAITFMGNVTSVGRNAFMGCASLSNINYYGTTEPSYVNALSSVTLYSSKGVSFCGLTPSNPPATQDPCSGDHTGWTELSSLTETVSGCYEINSGGKYYLSDDVRNGTNYRPTIRITCTEDVTLCLNGKTIYPAQSPSSRVVSLSDDSTLNLCDCAGTGCILGEDEILFAYDNATINMYSGALKDSMMEAVFLMEGASFNMYGGTITGCNRGYGNAAITSSYLSQINIYGGNISDNHKYAIRTEGSIYISGDAKITGNTEGDVYLKEGQTITAGTLTSGADIGITTAASENDIAITGSNTADYSRYFHSDNSSYAITNKGNTICLHKHTCTYSATENKITQTCSVCNKHTATATLTADDVIYTGAAIATGASVTFSDNWAGSKEHGEITYSNNLNVGDATAKVTVEGKELTTIFKINAANIAETTVTFNPSNITYDGSEQKPAVTVLWNGATLVEDKDYTLSWNSSDLTNAGFHTATITGKGNFTGTKTAAFTIDPADIKGAVVTIDRNTFDYDGQPHKPTAIVTFNGAVLTEGVDYELYYLSSDQIMTWENGEPVKFFGTGKENCDSINAGQYYAIVFGKGNFATSSRFAYAPYTIKQSKNNWVKKPWITDWTYGKSANVTVGEAKFGTVYVHYDGTANDGTTYNGDTPPTKAGSYIARFFVDETANYEPIAYSVPFTVKKANYNMIGAKWNYREPFQYNGKEHKVEVVGLPAGVTVESYENNIATTVGDYYAKVNLAYDVNNYNAPAINVLGWTIYNDWTPAEYTVNGSGWMNEDFVISAKNGYKISLTNTANGTWEDALTYSAETNNGSVTFYLKNETSGTISLAKTVSYKLDKTEPTGRVEFVERTGWEEFINTITFGLFYKDEVTVKVTAEDNLSGVAKIEYVYSNEAKTLNEVKEITDWTEYNGEFGVSLQDAKKFVYFVRITDNAGNVTYLSTDGAEYDTTAPVIDGVENGKTYYTTQKVTVTEKNVDTITLNGNPATENITLAGNKEATYTIVVTDNAGNATTVTVTMKPIKALASATENLGNDNVTSDDAPALEELVETLDALLADEDVSDGERETLEQHKHIAESLIDTINDAADATDTENVGKVENVTPENVTPENKTDLENAKADLEKALEENSGNYTEDEKKAIEDELGRIDDALEVIGNVEVVEDTVSKLPAVDTVKPDDEEAIKAITDAQTAYNALSDYEKSLVDEATKANLDKLAAALVAYDIVEGDGSSWTEDSNHNITFVVNGLFSKFVGIKVDGKDVDKANYEAKAGSTIITLKASYLDTLAVGEHTITVVYTDGSTDGTFNVHAKANSPATGDNSNMFLWIALLFISGGAVITLTVVDKKRRMASKR